MPSPITYVFADDPNLPDAVRGKTFTGGVPDAGWDAAGKIVRVVSFPHVQINGKPLAVLLAGRPDLAVAVSAYEEEERAEDITASHAEEAALEAAVPGIRDLIALTEGAEAEDNRYSRQFDAMMDDGDNDGLRPPRAVDNIVRERLDAALAANPRAALYLRAKRQAEAASWADNTGTGAAGHRAMEILALGGTMADATTALTARRNLVD